MPATLKLSKIGNSQGIRLPKRIIQRYGFKDEILLEERDDTLVLRAVPSDTKLDWEGTYKEMAASNENWDEWDVLSSEADSEFSEEW